ncbi:MAG: 50S ribosomal protein L15 [Verrucomicrobiota bacterium]
MRLHNIKPARGAKHRRKRLGAGESSGLGKTSGKGHKGQKSRSGASIRPGFEGGQMPLHRRLPKKGFNNTRFQAKVAIVNVGGLERAFAEGGLITETALREVGLVSGPCDAIKVLGNGKVTKAFTLDGMNCSKSAQEKIEKAGGSIGS